MTDRAPSVSAEAIAMYLESRSWNPVGTWRGTTVWQGSGPNTPQLVLPQEPEREDSQSLLLLAVEQLAALEDRPVERLLADLAQPSANTQHFRLLPATPSGTIPLRDSKRAVESILELHREAARSFFRSVRPASEEPRRQSEEVGHFLSRVQLCLTEPGSYIFTTKVTEPATAADPVQDPLFSLPETTSEPVYDHEIAAELQRSIGNAHRVATTLADVGDIEHPADQGVSPGLCSALANLGGMRRNRPFEVTFKWGLHQHQVQRNQTVHFSGSMASQLHDFAMKLERLGRTGAAVLEGKVEGLYFDKKSRKRRILVRGRVFLHGRWSEAAHWAVVSRQIYDEALRAHSNDRSVVLKGDLKREGKAYRLHSRQEDLEYLD